MKYGTNQLCLLKFKIWIFQNLVYNKIHISSESIYKYIVHKFMYENNFSKTFSNFFLVNKNFSRSRCVKGGWVKYVSLSSNYSIHLAYTIYYLK